ncbi:uncharacterized protein ASCRUDRAFT_73940 [Ascoidea rubescens DSM 1968]|uniref:Uncharacterized protein n=1 Tax=Ascoidea rubescens DSM 1968 TaxID=1344418 RepID=A0A1D2VRP4_9ASCO|nr:hypothetical protein ASCRUDRAFT_73940 [Ascoidea rubescens DSM 1968]ODV64283.1 hypothetical protein ASCRUDRAFT_73940 [Ascoidea rubescens DSM 1968]
MELDIRGNPLNRVNRLSQWINLSHLAIPDRILYNNSKDFRKLLNLKVITIGRCVHAPMEEFDKLVDKFPNFKLTFVERPKISHRWDFRGWVIHTEYLL